MHGAAYGAGLHLAVGADLRVVAPDAKLAFVEVNWGLVPDMSGSQALRRLGPLDVANRMAITGLAMEFECSGALMGSPNQMEAIGASFEKRDPQFADPSA